MKIYNSLTRRLDEFKPLKDKTVTIYVCGITPYDTTHLGHAFTYISFDALIRFLKLTGFKVIYTQNVTDINDRDKDLLERARQQKVPWFKLADFWTKKFLQDLTALNWVKPAYYIKASGYIPEISKLIQKLLKNKLAYQVSGSIYLDVTKDPVYGKLSRFGKRKMLKTAADFEEDLDNPDKKHPLDITLWRASNKNQPAHIPSFSSSFGKGRPGWHIECSTMSIATLGKQIDIHGGGRDLIFPHHEAEVAQSEGATGKIPFARYWLHTGVVFYQGAKMSKSKGNLVLVSDLLKKYSANAIRWLLLSHHFREVWEYFEKDIKAAQKSVDFIETALASQGVPLEPEERTKKQFIKIMGQNLNTPETLKFLLKLAKAKHPGLKNLYLQLGFKI